MTTNNQRICLNMIVKDEAHIMRRCLERRLSEQCYPEAQRERVAMNRQFALGTRRAD